MTPIDTFSKEWNRQVAEEEAKLGGIRVGPLQAVGDVGF